jgi:hypothetical protein
MFLDYCDTEFPARINPEGGRYYRRSTEQWMNAELLLKVEKQCF